MESTVKNQPVVTVTDNAIQEGKRLMEMNNLANANLRIGVEGGGCAGFSYSMNFDNEIREDDQVHEVSGIRVVVDTKSALYLYGTTLDYVTNLTGGGFRFSNPNAKQSCGCGTSFSA
ncbi:MAG: iron-sulfur cluster assembly accessory protein [Nitrospirae bacterium]|nr:iron-sulfur cluster assembly accessory protein [Nitrospirota bacterium]